MAPQHQRLGQVGRWVLMLYENSWMKKKDRVAVRVLFVLVLVVAGCDDHAGLDDEAKPARV